jgi:threonylcarbamoyladenosine tRNA methylthiotransferase MtaB
MIRRAIAQNPDAVVAVMGCYSQRARDEVARIEGVSAVFGNSDKTEVIPVIMKCLEEGKPQSPILAVRPLEGEKHDTLSLCAARRSRQFGKI